MQLFYLYYCLFLFYKTYKKSGGNLKSEIERHKVMSGDWEIAWLETLDVDAMSLWSLCVACCYNRATEK